MCKKTPNMAKSIKKKYCCPCAWHSNILSHGQNATVYAAYTRAVGTVTRKMSPRALSFSPGIIAFAHSGAHKIAGFRVAARCR